MENKKIKIEIKDKKDIKKFMSIFDFLNRQTKYINLNINKQGIYITEMCESNISLTDIHIKPSFFDVFEIDFSAAESVETDIFLKCLKNYKEELRITIPETEAEKFIILGNETQEQKIYFEEEKKQQASVPNDLEYETPTKINYKDFVNFLTIANKDTETIKIFQDDNKIYGEYTKDKLTNKRIFGENANPKFEKVKLSIDYLILLKWIKGFDNMKMYFKTDYPIKFILKNKDITTGENININYIVAPRVDDD